ncbi:interleukin-22 receptor subunit alpha-2 isoform X1 [Centrocercus urophasianus]|uniref:interleukin-22 receptor subunit alpha-2 isoform X1 n=1 Tax=Centrocercus urophasianus TaxID=9002 RepID=UPI001C64BA96|nr:interleukin-22 receptor subunit alpha-2 isoform X1 [Centrocercus urophasianus]XP_042669639.1 interleukin-22 receptor subunit alpha-2 isoform X1 [Centrocercus urophasianus]
MPKRKRDALSHGAALLSMRGIRLSSLCFLMHLLQDKISTIPVLENRDLQDAIKPRGVRFYSLNFNNTLRWLPGRAGEGETTLYFVQYKVYGQSKWQNKEECWGIQSHFCDLTEETSDAYEAYYSRVQAASTDVRSDWSLSCRFTPWRETMIGPPTIKVVHSNKFVILKLQAPRSAYKRKRGSMIPMTNYYDLLYQVFIINNLLDGLSHRHTCMTSCFSSLCLKQHSVLVYEGKDKVIKIEDLRPGISYCIVARTSVLVLGRSSAYSNRQCTVLL